MHMHIHIHTYIHTYICCPVTFTRCHSTKRQAMSRPWDMASFSRKFTLLFSLAKYSLRKSSVMVLLDCWGCVKRHDINANMYCSVPHT